MKKVFNLMPRVAMVLMMCIWCSCGNANQAQIATNSVVKEMDGVEEKEVVTFLKNFYEDLENNISEFQNHNASKFSRYMVKSAMEKLLTESDYEEEGDPYFYDTEFFTDGTVSGSQHGDYNYPVSRDISLDEGHWYKIYTEFHNNIPAPTLIKVKVEKLGNKYMITDIQLNKILE